ncbi:class I mannose-6-phosphate isomerase [Paraflavisolibacter sp. H34]|uniref:class I mannose-6-phosphate isomerase n=1 Tax=Huijunlia imazamoxiresistens TaxID=3127457 RepID=UPI0030199307
MQVLDNTLATAPVTKKWRATSETILPQTLRGQEKQPSGYDIYPSHAVGAGKIFSGYASLAQWIIKQKTVLIDGYIGIFWEEVRQCLEQELQQAGVTVNWILLDRLRKGPEAIEQLVAPFLGTPGSVWGTRSRLDLRDFFQADRLSAAQPDARYDVNIALGIGAALLPWSAPVVYLDIPKNEIQFRMRAKSVTNFGSDRQAGNTEMYKRFYFVDWPILNTHKKALLDRIAVIADAQWKESVNWMPGADLKAGLQQLSRSVYRVRPWFEPGAWGGHWMKERFQGLNKEAVNYAWSFELIVPENGIVFESDGNLLEVSFDFLMFRHAPAVLGRDAAVFGDEFPIRFDFLDTFEGGNLSIQCHPSLPYVRREFGENITQDETYYILDCKQDAQVYLGFQEDIDPKTFRQELEYSQESGQEIPITRYVQAHTAQKHGLYLIPNGTVHSAGAGSLVLEISATPYIFTFKMYDWQRLDLNGQPRPINIDHAFNNLNFERKGERVKKELISQPVTLAAGADWELVHLPTHEDHFYDVHRMEFDSRLEVDTRNTVHVLMLVEGEAVRVETADGTVQTFQYAETFVIPAAAERYTLTNLGAGRAKVVKAFIKENICFPG